MASSYRTTLGATLLALLLASHVPAAPPAQAAAPVAGPEPTHLVITYLGNEGFLLQAGEIKVLVDALQGDGLAPYETLPEARRRTLEQALPPFDGVQLVLASHSHPDHFDATAVARYLEHNFGAKFVSTEQAADELRKQAGDVKGLQERIRGFHPEAGKRVPVPLKGIDLTVVNLHHGASETQNLGLLIQLGEFRVLHVGDTEATPAEFAGNGIPGESFDVAFLPYWLLFEPGWREAVAGARHVVAMHVPPAEAPALYFGSSASLEKLRELLRGKEPGLILFEQLLQQQSIPTAATARPEPSP